MAARGFLSHFLDFKCFLCISHARFSILSLTFAYCNSLSSNVGCTSNNIAAEYQHCRSRADGVHDLDCFGKYYSKDFTCVWKPGNVSSHSTYTLVIMQQFSSGRKTCNAHYNITDFSKTITVFKSNMTVEVFENRESKSCTRADFRGLPKSLQRCAPPNVVWFSRYAGRVDVNVSWQSKDGKVIKFYSVRYKTLSSHMWNQPPVRCQNGGKCSLENVTASLLYNVQIQCVTNEKCSQCVWSKVYIVPPELTTQPIIVDLKDTDVTDRKGQRLLSFTWKFPSQELHDGYHVMIGKTSGDELREQINTKKPEIRFILSYSAYHINISAFNNASTSPAVSYKIPKRVDESSLGDGRLNVTAHSNTSFTLHWKDNLIQKYVCYSVEWTSKGQEAEYMSFYEDENNFRTISLSSEPLKPYKRYDFTLHTRPDKDTCNMKHVNNSESTYAATRFYFMEGAPVSAPPNISCSNVTLNSVVLEWTPIPEEDARGFLLGYIIHYSEYHHTGTSREKNITVDAGINTWELEDLESGTAYKVQVSGFTQAGVGVQSTESVFKTNFKENSNISSLVVTFAVVASVLIFGSPFIKRVKRIVWPSVPNPKKSNTMQKIEGIRELELLEFINPLRVEEWDTDSLQIVKKAEVIPFCTFTPTLSLLQTFNDDGNQEMTCDWVQSDSEEEPEDIPPDCPAQTVSDPQQTCPQSIPFTFTTGYTTVEMFQQGMPVNTSVTPGTASKPEDKDSTVVK